VLFLSSIFSACGREAVTDATLNQSDDNWCHVGLSATDGTTINVDYQVNGPYGRGSYYQLSHVWVNVSNNKVNSNAKVRAVLIHKNQSATTYQLDLQSAGSGRFSGSLNADQSITGNTYDQTSDEIAVVVNGQWLKDPISRNNNFKFNFSRNRTCSQ
jgi:hypothetical protein